MNNVNKVALILSFIFPGFGQIWNREYIKGINFILLQIIFIMLVFYPDSNLFPIGMVAIPILWIWGMVDASRIHYNYPPEHRRRRSNTRLTLGIIALLILSEAIFVSTILTIRRNYKTSSEEKIYSELRRSFVPSDARSHPENGEESTYAFNDASKNALSISESSTSVDDKAPPAGQASPSHPWVVTVSVSEKYDEIRKLYFELSKKYQVQIIPVSSNPKQNAYAVAITGFATILDAENIATKLRKDIPKCFVASYENPTIPVK